MKRITTAALMAILVASAAHSAAAPQRKTPYWASLSAGQARMRNGPGRNYPVGWFYQRQGLPVQVLEVYPGWRKVRDPDGTEGWMIANLIGDQRTGMIRNGTADLLDAPNVGGKVLWRAEAGVIGTVSHCASGWCKLDVKGRSGFVEEAKLWGVDPDETLD
jgi:SH3-like domain-containing protein